ncbi:STAS domain-containing protein [Parvibium lacunae]|uniref:Anti-sigma factor antagonist n=1 Tax=Parvibium lacunae TaxID=1888893 RepID=A0A368L8D1_9BURK|nr:STAS domain-containing protein [Parvibium lacunae]RCS59867.1 anti-sigma factor antagonist [Parvibium lacunae]
MNIEVFHNDNFSKVVLNGRFDFTAHRAFKQAYETALTEGSTSQVKIDMSAVDYLDSSALGMLLILRDRAKETSKSVSLINCGGSVREVLRVANFDKLFTLE